MQLAHGFFFPLPPHKSVALYVDVQGRRVFFSLGSGEYSSHKAHFLILKYLLASCCDENKLLGK